LLGKKGWRKIKLKEEFLFQKTLSTDSPKGFITDEVGIPDDLSSEAIRSLSVSNAGGRSEVSEAYSIDYFTRCFNAKEFVLEKEIEYWIDYKMLDFICSINGERIGVSVTRAFKSSFPKLLGPKIFDDNEAKRLIDKKLSGLIIARNVYYMFGVNPKK